MKWNKYLFVVIVALAFAMGSIAAQQQRPVQPPPENAAWGPQTREEKRKLADVRQKQGLRAAASLYGGYFEGVDFDNELTAGDISLLADMSEVVVRGLVKSNRSLLLRGEHPGYFDPVETIVTDYQVAVFDVYKGNLRLLSRDITVRIPGGRVEFEDGLWAEVRTRDFVPPLDQQEFIFFLNPHESEENVYSVTFGRQGLFEVKAGGWVNPRAKTDSPVARKAKRDFGEFLKQLNQAIGKGKRGGKIER